MAYDELCWDHGWGQKSWTEEKGQIWKEMTQKVATDFIANADKPIVFFGIHHNTTKGVPDPDLIIRTGGDCRLSNFLLWQSAYSELIFIKKFWPEFSQDDFLSAIKEFNQRDEGIDTTNAIPCSGKTGEGIDDILEAIINKLPPPKGISNDKLKCLLVDSWYDSYLGVVILVRVINGKLKKGMKIKLMSNNQEYVIEKVGVFTPKPTDIDELNCGEIGFIITGIKSLSETKVGDTICDATKPKVEALPGFKPSKPVVFCGLFPVDSSEYQKLKDGLAKLQLNDASFSYEAESSLSLIHI